MIRTAKSTGRIIGVLLLVQIVAGITVNFALTAPLFESPGFLVNAAANSFQISLSVIIGLGLGALSVGIAITIYPVFRQYSQAMAMWYVALAVVGFALIAVENTAVMSMLSLSQTYTKANGADSELFQALKALVGSARNWAHYINLIVGGAMGFVFYSTLFRFALVPRALAAFGMGAILLQITAVTMPVFGYKIVFLMLLPIALTHLAMALWLMTKGFAERRPLASSLRE